MKRRRLMRLLDHDYREHGSYFVTIRTHNAVGLFGKVEDGETILSNMGNIAYDEWLRTARVRSNVELDAFVVMPNHIHGIICIFDDDTWATHRVAPTRDTLPSTKQDRATRQSKTLQAGSLGAIVGQYKSAVTRRGRRLFASQRMPIWQRGYYDSVLQSERTLNDVRSYIATNPERWNEETLYAPSERFAVSDFRAIHRIAPT